MLKIEFIILKNSYSALFCVIKGQDRIKLETKCLSQRLRRPKLENNALNTRFDEINIIALTTIEKTNYICSGHDF